MTSATSSDGSLGAKGSAPTAGSTSRKSLDELLSSRRDRDGDYADMPSLSSFRADDNMSAVTSASIISHASNSRAGDSRAGDDNASLPSLSSFRMEDLSTCSSYHSIQTTNHLSDHSGEAWSSFRSGNVSIDTHADSDDGRRRMKLGIIRVASGPVKGTAIGRRTQGASLPIPILPAAPAKGVLKQDSRRPQHEMKSERSTVASEEVHNNDTQSKSSTRKVSPIVKHGVPGNTQNEIAQGNASGSESGALASEMLDVATSERAKGVQRTKSLEMQPSERPVRNFGAPISRESIQVGGPSEGSSSSLRGADILPRLPRRSSTAVLERGNNAVRFTEDDASHDASRLSDESTRISSDDGEVSIGSGVESDISIETDADSHCMASDLSERSIIETQSVTLSEEPSLKKQAARLPLKTYQSEERSVTAQSANLSAKTSDHDAKSEGLQEDPSKRVLGNSYDKADPSDAPPTETAPLENFVNHEIHSAKESSDTPSEKGKGPNNEKLDEGDTSTTKIDTVTEEQNPSDNRRGLLRRVSSSLKGIGRSASFRNSFRMIGKQASKLKLKKAAK